MLENYYCFISWEDLCTIGVERGKTSCLENLCLKKSQFYLLLRISGILSPRLLWSWSIWDFLIFIVRKSQGVKSEVGTVLFSEVIKMKSTRGLLWFHSEIMTPNNCINEVAGQPGAWWYCELCQAKRIASSLVLCRSENECKQFCHWFSLWCFTSHLSFSSVIS